VAGVEVQPKVAHSATSSPFIIVLFTGIEGANLHKGFCSFELFFLKLVSGCGTGFRMKTTSLKQCI